MKTFFSILFLVLPCFLIAQPYAPIRSGGYLLYSNGVNNIGLRADSIKSNGTDSVYYFNRNIRRYIYIPASTTTGCNQRNGPSWMGGKAIYSNQGTFRYFNQFNDTITIHTNVPVGYSWTCFSRKSDTLKVNATVIKRDTATFLQTLDSIIVIQFSYMGKDSLSTRSGINKKMATISRNNGFVSLFPFYYFPDINKVLFDQVPTTTILTVSGISWQNKGLQNLTWKKTFNFEVGDELHIQERSVYSAYDGYTYDSTLTIQTVVQKTLKGDTTIYYLSKLSWNSYYKSTISIPQTSGKKITRGFDTLYIASKKSFDVLPSEVFFSPIPNNSIQLYGLEKSANGLLKKIDYGDFDNFFSSIPFQSDTCIYTYLAEYPNCDIRNEYWEGVGGPYFDCLGSVYGDSYGTQENHRNLLYYKKGTISWGTPINGDLFLGVDENSIPLEILTLSPNPVNTILKINAPEGTALEVMDWSGRTISSLKCMGTSCSLDVSQYSPGLYMCRNAKFNVKFIVQH